MINYEIKKGRQQDAYENRNNSFDAETLAKQAEVLAKQTGGPRWDVPLGRRDSLRASLSDSNHQEMKL
ncbi:peroxidase 72-like protein [Tanacetum coccineum]